jgi:hypothetical protein
MGSAFSTLQLPELVGFTRTENQGLSQQNGRSGRA